MTPTTHYRLRVTPKVPPQISRLEELANTLWYSWDHHTRELFAQLNPALWNAVGHSPKAFLRHVDEKTLTAAAADPVFLNSYIRVLSTYDAYHGGVTRTNGHAGLDEADLVAYFCAEFGFHESLPIYSGGLGILAGDHCKAASDLNLPFVAVGLLYRQGYFSQTIDQNGVQHVAYTDSNFEELPLSPVLSPDGTEIQVQVDLAGRDVHVKVWRAQVGHVTLYLLDTDVPANTDHDRRITYRLYGGDRQMRIEQEIILGVAGRHALSTLGLKPAVWHINEGHAAFLILERVRDLVKQGLRFAVALEAVAATTVFTTHTAVPAGHDHFSEDLIRVYFDAYCREVSISHDELMALGKTASAHDFNMTALAVRGSRHHNGVSRVHRGVTASMLGELWPEIAQAESPVDYITNGVHVPTFLSSDWAHAFSRFMGSEWSRHMGARSWWSHIDRLPDHVFWSVHQYLKTRMLHLVRYRVSQQHQRNHGSDIALEKKLRHMNPDDPNVLTIGFGRRFATYKRADLLFNNLERLRKIVSDPDRPVLFIFAGKAHPADGPGQAIIQRVVEISQRPDFVGKILFVDGYDLRLGRRLVSGVDVWLNNPLYPLEACGTSGMKAGINGVINLSVLDGWWDEGFTKDNGWAIEPVKYQTDAAGRDHDEAESLYNLLEEKIIPLYYDRGKMGYSQGWIHTAKRSMATILPQFSADRMVREYLAKFYAPAAKQGHRYAADNFRAASDLVAWKQKILAAWASVRVRHGGPPQEHITFGEGVRLEAAVWLGNLQPEDVQVELLLDRDQTVHKHSGHHASYAFKADGTTTSDGELRFVLELGPEHCGDLHYQIRCYPHHPSLTHRFELGKMVWA